MKKVIGVIVGIILVLAVVFFVGARGYAKKHTVVLTNANESSRTNHPTKGKSEYPCKRGYEHCLY